MKNFISIHIRQPFLNLDETMNTKSKCNSRVCKGAVRTFLHIKEDGRIISHCTECYEELPNQFKMTKRAIKERIYAKTRRAKREETILGRFVIIRRKMKGFPNKEITMPQIFKSNTEAEQFRQQYLKSALRYYTVIQKK